jgi:hypothetical protein
VVAPFGSGKMRKLKREKKNTCHLEQVAPTTHVVGTVIKEFQNPFKLFLNITNIQCLG